MKIIDINLVDVVDRQRKEIDATKLRELESSILKEGGLLQPPGVLAKDGRYQLVFGERRLRAIQAIQKREEHFVCDGKTILPGELPVVEVTASDLLGLKTVEFDENFHRVDLTWQERTQALADMHNLHKSADDSHTVSDTVQILRDTTGASRSQSFQKVREALVVSEHLSNPKIANARNESEAYTLVLKAEEEKLTAQLAARRLAAMPSVPEIEIRNADCRELLPQLADNLADLILVDPPYGINAGSAGFRERTVHHHNYEDTPESAREIAQAIIFEGFRITKPRANLFMFCDIDLFPVIKEMAGRVGWKVFRTPLTWLKSESEGLAPWGGKGPRRTCEWLMYATKGERFLISSPVDVLNVKRVPRKERIHAAQKPVELLRKLIECSTLPGDFVLDPCCGSGSTLVAARESRRRGMGIEFDKDFFNTAMANVHSPSESEEEEVNGTGAVESRGALSDI